jgi:hypothetical protein
MDQLPPQTIFLHRNILERYFYLPFGVADQTSCFSVKRRSALEASDNRLPGSSTSNYCAIPDWENRQLLGGTQTLCWHCPLWWAIGWKSLPWSFIGADWMSFLDIGNFLQPRPWIATGKSRCCKIISELDTCHITHTCVVIRFRSISDPWASRIERKAV